MNDDEIRQEARNEFECDEIQFDDEPEVSKQEDGRGAWVQAWVWVPLDEEGREKP
jgi:hypothetical protein